MLHQKIILQSAGSLAIALFALFLTVVHAFFFFRQQRYAWYAWSASLSFLSFIYSLCVFFEYNLPAGDLNRYAGIIEWIAIVCLLHCFYGFTFSYLGIKNRWYHPVAGAIHGLIILMMCFTNYFLSDTFVARSFLGLSSPYVEIDLGPLGPVFVLYCFFAAVYAIWLWIKHKEIDLRLRSICLAGMIFWLLLGLHDSLAVLGVSSIQYVMEYGFLGFALFVFWVVSSSHMKLTEKEKYQTITEYAGDCIMVIQEGKMVFSNPACMKLFGRTFSEAEKNNLMDLVVPEDRKIIYSNYKKLMAGDSLPNPLAARFFRADGTRRFVEVAASVIHYIGRPAVLAILRDMTERKKVEEERESLIIELKDALRRVRSLSGLLPICSVCKKIRDDTGYWNRLEEYIEAHSEADFTHSICPECAEKLYPGLNIKAKVE